MYNIYMLATSKIDYNVDFKNADDICVFDIGYDNSYIETEATTIVQVVKHFNDILQNYHIEQMVTYTHLSDIENIDTTDLFEVTNTDGSIFNHYNIHDFKAWLSTMTETQNYCISGYKITRTLQPQYGAFLSYEKATQYVRDNQIHCSIQTIKINEE